MTPELDQLLRRLEPATDENLGDRLRFGLECALRVSFLLENPEVLSCLNRFKAFVQGEGITDEVPTLIAELEGLATGHQGSRSLDGVGHAAVSATYACAKAAAGRARQASEYAAYAMVYGQGGYSATSDPESFSQEHQWQAATLRALLNASQSAASAA